MRDRVARTVNGSILLSLASLVLTRRCSICLRACVCAVVFCLGCATAPISLVDPLSERALAVVNEAVEGTSATVTLRDTGDQGPTVASNVKVEREFDEFGQEREVRRSPPPVQLVKVGRELTEWTEERDGAVSRRSAPTAALRQITIKDHGAGALAGAAGGALAMAIPMSIWMSCVAAWACNPDVVLGPSGVRSAVSNAVVLVGAIAAAALIGAGLGAVTGLPRTFEFESGAQAKERRERARHERVAPALPSENDPCSSAHVGATARDGSGAELVCNDGYLFGHYWVRR